MSQLYKNKVMSQLTELRVVNKKGQKNQQILNPYLVPVNFFKHLPIIISIL